MIIKFPIKTVSEANRREHWAAKNKRLVKQKADFRLLWRSHRIRALLPVEIVFTRFSCRVLDDDNLRSAFKAIRDVVAQEIGIDDGSELLNFVYRQEKIDKREHYFTVEINSLRAATIGEGK